MKTVSATFFIGISICSFACALFLATMAPTAAEGSEATEALASSQVALDRNNSLLAQATRAYAESEKVLDARIRAAEDVTLRLKRLNERVASVKSDLVDKREAAERRLDADRVTHQKEVSKHEDTTSMLIGLGVGCLFIAIAVGLSPRVQRQDLPRRLRGKEAPAILGMAALGALWIISLALLVADADAALRTVAFALLLGVPGVVIVLVGIPVLRRSDEGSEGRNRRRRVRLLAVFACLFILAFGGLFSAGLLLDQPRMSPPPPQIALLARQAQGDPAYPPNKELLAAQRQLGPVLEEAQILKREADRAHQRFVATRGALRRARVSTRMARRAVVRNTKRVANEAAARQSAAAPIAPSSPPTYSTCAGAPANIPVPPGSPLDADGDGVGCEG